MELQMALKISLYFIFHYFFMKHVFLEISSSLNYSCSNYYKKEKRKIGRLCTYLYLGPTFSSSNSQETYLESWAESYVKP